MPTIEKIMTRDPLCCRPDDKVVDCAKLMEHEDVGFVPIVESLDTRKLLGVVTDRDLCMQVIAQGRDPNECTLEELMTDELVSIGPQEELQRALDLMAQNQIRRLPVVDEHGACIGILSQGDVAKVASPHQLKATVTAISATP